MTLKTKTSNGFFWKGLCLPLDTAILKQGVMIQQLNIAGPSDFRKLFLSILALPKL